MLNIPIAPLPAHSDGGKGASTCGVEIVGVVHPFVLPAKCDRSQDPETRTESGKHEGSRSRVRADFKLA